MRFVSGSCAAVNQTRAQTVECPSLCQSGQISMQSKKSAGATLRRFFSTTVYLTSELLVESWGEPWGIFPTSGTRALMRSARCHLCRFQLNRRASHFRVRLFHVSCSIIRLVSAKSRPFVLSSAKGRALRSPARRERSARNPLPLSRLRQRSVRKR
jgi:hypothetical protein